MCWSRNAALFTVVVLAVNLFFHAVYVGSSDFAKTLRPFVIAWCLVFGMLEMWDYSLWRANERGQCYDIATIAGQNDIFATMSTIYALNWYHRRDWNGWDSRLYFANAALFMLGLVYLAEVGSDIIPKDQKVYNVNRNFWFSDRPEIYGFFLPFYMSPLVYGWWKERDSTDRFGCMTWQINTGTLVAFIIAFGLDRLSWGSVW